MSQLIATNGNQDEVVDISLESSRRKRFRIDKDDNRILELDTTDLSIVDRFQKKYDELVTVVDTAFKDIPAPSEDGTVDTESVNAIIGSIADVDVKIRTIIDQIFNSNVSELCAPTGSMLDPINGKLRFEHIFDTLVPLYEADINSEMKKMTARVQKHTSKYIR